MAYILKHHRIVYPSLVAVGLHLPLYPAWDRVLFDQSDDTGHGMPSKE